MRKSVVLDCAVEIGVTPGAPKERVLVGFTYAIAKFGAHGTESASAQPSGH